MLGNRSFRTFALTMALVSLLAGCNSDDGGGITGSSQAVYTAVEATLTPIILFMDEGEDPGIDGVVFEITGQDSVTATFTGYLHAESGLTLSGELMLERTIDEPSVSLTVTGTVTITGGTVSELVWNATATGDYDAESDDFDGPPNVFTGIIKADGVDYPFSEFSDIFTDENDDPTEVTDPRFVVAGMTGTIIYSDDGSAWGWPNVASAGETGVESNLLGIDSDDQGVCVAVGGGGTILRSTNGTDWAAVTSPTSNDLQAVAWAAGRWVAFFNASNAFYSDDGVTWTQATVEGGTPDHMYDAVGDGSGGFVAVGMNYTALISSDNGANWSVVKPFPTNILNFRSVAYDGNGGFIAVGDAGIIARSGDIGATWTHAAGSSQVATRLTGVGAGNGVFVAVGEEPVALLRSLDGDAWNDISPLIPAEFVATGHPLTDLATDGAGRWSVIGGWGDHLLSIDNGASWTAVALDLYGQAAISYRP